MAKPLFLGKKAARIGVVKVKENENRIGYYSVIPATVLYNKELKANEKLLYAIITSLACKEGYCFASNEYLAEKLGVNRKTVSSWILWMVCGSL